LETVMSDVKVRIWSWRTRVYIYKCIEASSHEAQ